ncbi:MAG: hypothetical protein ABI760_00380 [Ferruginibacter sp.]
MKKTSLLVAMLVTTATTLLQAQPFKKGTNVLSAGIGFGSSIGSGYSGTQSPAISVQYEKSLWEVNDIGVISLGGYAGRKSFSGSSKSGSFSYSQKWNYTIIGLRSAFHYTGINSHKLDVYAGAIWSYNMLSYKFRDNSGNSSVYNAHNYGSTAGFTGYIGGRYFFKEKLSVFAELGYGVSYITAGLSFKF